MRKLGCGASTVTGVRARLWRDSRLAATWWARPQRDRGDELGRNGRSAIAVTSSAGTVGGGRQSAAIGELGAAAVGGDLMRKLGGVRCASSAEREGGGRR